MTRISTRRQWLRNWANLALFAMLALLVSPALAWNCCCHEVSQTPVQLHAQSCCEKSSGASIQTISSVDCGCETAQRLIASAPESIKAPFFAPLLVVAPVSPFHWTDAETTTAFNFAQFSLPPPQNHFRSSRGRAPPVLALS